MIRIVSLRKAVLAGIAGAAAWEIVLRGIGITGFPLIDIVRTLGTLAFQDNQVAGWWVTGMIAHSAVGALWATFYAYFFWSRLNRSPVLQGIVFSLIPAILALFVAYPQMVLMHQHQNIAAFEPHRLIAAIQWREVAGLLLGHLFYGAVMGALYTRPVGYSVTRLPHISPGRGHSIQTGGNGIAEANRHSRFIFATGIECSYPTLEGGKWRYDQMEASGHYRHWRRDFELAREIGVSHLRWGPPLHLVYQGPDRFDWNFTDEAMGALREARLEPIVDLCHFGLPFWLGDFQNPEVPQALCRYAEAFADRYEWVRFYTPINEIYVCARLSALDGIWNEQRSDERSFVTAVRHLAKASVLMMDAISARRQDAIFVNSESGEFSQACCPDPEIIRIAELENERRFLPLDLIYVRPLSDFIETYLLENGMTKADCAWFMNRPSPRRAILGVDYYEWNEKLIDSDGRMEALGELFGWYVIASQYYQRYERPMMHTETNSIDARKAPRWLWRQWHNMQLLRKSGVPLVGFTWYSLTDQTDWDIALRYALGTVNPCGLVDLNRDLRPVGLAYKHLIESWADNPDFADCKALADLVTGESSP